MAKLEKLQNRWNLKNTTQVIFVLIVFALTGTTVVFLRGYVFEFLGLNNISNTFLYVVSYILIIFPLYQIFLLVYGFIFGQFRFFWEFEKKMLKRFSFGRKKKKEEDVAS